MIISNFLFIVFLDRGSADSSGEEDSDEDDETMKGQPDAHDLVSLMFLFLKLF